MDSGYEDWSDEFEEWYNFEEWYSEDEYDDFLLYSPYEDIDDSFSAIEGLSSAERLELWLSRENLLDAGILANDFQIDLSDAFVWDIGLTESELKDAKANIDNLSQAESRDFTEADLNGVDFTETDLKDVNLYLANLRDAKLYKADLRGANLTLADLSYANLSYADLSDADLSYAILTYANLSGAKFNASTTLPNGKKWTPETDMTQFTRP